MSVLLYIYFTALKTTNVHKLFAYGCPDKARECDKRRDKELLKRLYKIYNEYWSLRLGKRHISILSTRNVIWTLGNGGGWHL